MKIERVYRPYLTALELAVTVTNKSNRIFCFFVLFFFPFENNRIESAPRRTTNLDSTPEAQVEVCNNNKCTP
jgi:hypothetical protein